LGGLFPSAESSFLRHSLNFRTMLIDDLWELDHQIRHLLSQQLSSEKRKLEQRLSQLQGEPLYLSSQAQKRPYPKVLPKYQTPTSPLKRGPAAARNPSRLANCCRREEASKICARGTPCLNHDQALKRPPSGCFNMTAPRPSMAPGSNSPSLGDGLARGPAVQSRRQRVSLGGS
jgi:DNA-binding protein H-NS